MAKPQLRKPKKKVGPVKAIKVGAIDYKDTATLRKFISDRGIASLDQAQTARAWLADNVITVTASAGANGRLFGAVTTAVLADAVKEAGGPAIDRRKIEVIPPIKSTGRHSASVRLHTDVVAPLEVNVVAAR